MPLYFFHLSNGCPYQDIDGLELPTLEAAHEEAVGFASDVIKDHIKQYGHHTGNWSVIVTDEGGRQMFKVAFPKLDGN